MMTFVMVAAAAVMAMVVTAAVMIMMTLATLKMMGVVMMAVVVVHLLGYSDVGPGECNVPGSRYSESRERDGLWPATSFLVVQTSPPVAFIRRSRQEMSR